LRAGGGGRPFFLPAKRQKRGFLFGVPAEKQIFGTENVDKQPGAWL
jgi:hypothetical protein